MGMLLLFVVILTSSTTTTLLMVPVKAQERRAYNECPSLCVCSKWLSLPKASCTGRRLYSIHASVPSVVQALDLSNNSIGSLEDRQLSRAGLTRLKYLNLSMNAINEIGGIAFDNLKNLTVLDLSMNRLDYIAPDTFYYNQNLRVLRLAGNKFNLRVPKLQSNSLTELDLSACRINHLLKDTFSGLKQLRKLYLTSNMMYELDIDVLKAMPFLRNLLLGQNFWSCDGSIFDLKIYLRSKNIKTDTFCEKPGSSNKFEKIIALKTISTEKEPKVILPETEKINKDPWDGDTWDEFEDTIQEQQPTDSTSGIFANALNNVSPFWFLLIGFLLGSGATMVVTYLWLSTTISCLIPRIRRAEAADSADVSSQRVSLLRHLWHQENMTGSEESSTGTGNITTATILPSLGTTPSCPGTPPPPYREVMLHRNLYPRAAMVAAAHQQASNRQFIATAPLNETHTTTAYNV